MFRVLLCGVCALTISVDAFGQEGYQKPPQAVVDILDAPAPPALSVSPTGENILLVQSARYPSIEEVAAPMLRLAGLRINPKTNGPARPPRVTGLSLVPVTGGDAEADRASRKGPHRAADVVAGRQAVRRAQHHRQRHRTVGVRDRRVEVGEGAGACA